MLAEIMCTDAHVYGAFNIAYGVGSACEFDHLVRHVVLL